MSEGSRRVVRLFKSDIFRVTALIFWTILWLKLSLLRQIGNDFEEYPRAPTLIANRSTTQPFFSMTLAGGVYLFNFWERQFSIFSSQGQVNFSRTARFEDFENNRISRRSSESANWNGNK